MRDHSSLDSGRPTGHFLIYSADQGARELCDRPADHPPSGMIVRASQRSSGARAARGLRSRGFDRFLGVDAGSWTRLRASPDRPMDLPDDGLFPVTLDDWSQNIASEKADLVLSPSGFVDSDDWDALGAVLLAGRATDRPDVRTLVATDATMLDPPRAERFVDHITGEPRPLALIFAAKSAPLAPRARLSALRRLMSKSPGTWLLATDVLVATDAVVRGATAACGLTSGTRRPTRPGDRGGQPAADWVPGTFLRELWEMRSPPIYAHWYTGHRSPTCAECGGRAVDGFTAAPADKEQIVRHNLHAWQAVNAELSSRSHEAASRWLIHERRRALDAHLAVRPVGSAVEADATLRHLCELDDPYGRRTSPSGAWPDR